MDLEELDIAVNAVATAVKDFFFKRLPPLLPMEHMADLESIASMQVSFHPCNMVAFLKEETLKVLGLLERLLFSCLHGLKSNIKVFNKYPFVTITD